MNCALAKPPDPHAPVPRVVPPPAAGLLRETAVRRIAQHLQGRGTRGGWMRPPPVRAPQGCHAGRSAQGHAAGAGGIARPWPAGADRRVDGHGVVRARGRSHGEALSWSSACHGAGRSMSRHQATRQWRGRKVVDDLAARGILVRSPFAARRGGGSAGRPTRASIAWSTSPRRPGWRARWRASSRSSV